MWDNFFYGHFWIIYNKFHSLNVQYNLNIALYLFSEHIVECISNAVTMCFVHICMLAHKKIEKMKNFCFKLAKYFFSFQLVDFFRFVCDWRFTFKIIHSFVTHYWVSYHMHMQFIIVGWLASHVYLWINNLQHILMNFF